MVFQSRQPYWVDRCRPARRCKTLVLWILGDDLHVKVRVTHWVEESKLDESEKLFKGKHSNFKLHFFADSVRCENCRKCENLEYNNLEGGTLPEYLRTCNNIQTLCPLDRELEYSPLEYLSVFCWLSLYSLIYSVLFDSFRRGQLCRLLFFVVSLSPYSKYRTSHCDVYVTAILPDVTELK